VQTRTFGLQFRGCREIACSGVDSPYLGLDVVSSRGARGGYGRQRRFVYRKALLLYISLRWRQI
jgi:hypothetical protein